MIVFEGLPHWCLDTEVELAEWLVRVAEAEGACVGQLQYKCVEDEEILEINRKYLEHDYYTDIITFGYREGRVVEAEVFIGYETVYSNAKDLDIAPPEELRRVILHGLLHLLGYDDRSASSKQKMRDAEEKYLLLRAKNLC